ncbi:anhydro-N-acetylmuramic acid kinase [soil metagenome]
MTTISNFHPPASSAPTRRVVGCMTGTSLDALDLALLEISGRGLTLTARLLRTHSEPLAVLAPLLRACADQSPLPAATFAGAAALLARLHADAITTLLAGERADLICVHGQTIFHAPPLSWQLFSAPALAAAARTPVVFDLRAADLAAGGQGAPITPLADLILFGAPHPRAVVNLGGFCNLTLLPAVTTRAAARPLIRGFDVCACNHILDAVARIALHAPFDEDGAAAQRGTPHAPTAATLAALLTRQSAAARSLGSGDELTAFIQTAAAALRPEDLAATAVDALARVITARIPPHTETILAGGGAKNRALTAVLARHLGATPRTTADFGIPIDMREAACMALLGALCHDRVPITLPAVTGAPREVISGCWAFAPDP